MADEELPGSEESEQNPSVINLKIETLLNNKRYDVTVPILFSVAQVKLMISHKYNCNMLSQSLIYGETLLSDEQTLEMLKIPNDAVLHLVPKMKTGPLNYRVNTLQLKKMLRSIETEINELYKRIKDGNELHPDDIVEIEMGSDGRISFKDYRPVKDSTIDAKMDKESADVTEINLDIHDTLGQNARTRQNMKQVKEKLQRYKDRRKAIQQQRKTAEFVDAKLIIDEHDWNKLVRLTKQNEAKEKKELRIKADKSKNERSKEISEQGREEESQVSDVESENEDVTEPQDKQCEQKSENKKTGSNPPSEQSDPSISEQFFDCQEFVDDDDEKPLLNAFADWLNRSYFHYKVKYLEKSNMKMNEEANGNEEKKEGPNENEEKKQIDVSDEQSEESDND